MAGTFTLDTSGSVGPMAGWEHPVPDCDRFILWDKLTPFTQGYVRAALESLGEGLPRWNSHDERTEMDHARFTDLSPEALAVMIADCEAYQHTHRDALATALHPDPLRPGRMFWIARQNGATAWPKLTLSLSDDGKIVLAVAS